MGSKFPYYYNEDGVMCFAPTFSNPINRDFPYGKGSLDAPKQGFVEHRIELKETTHPRMPVTVANSGVDVDALYYKNIDGTSERPMLVQVLGTLIGNDHAGDEGRSKYGTILRPSIFGDPLSSSGNLQEVPCNIDNGRDEVSTLAVAYTLKFPNSGTAFYVNKQGKYFANIASSTGIDPVGAGESVEINTGGHAKLYLGQNAQNRRSLSLNTAGGVSTNWGFDKVKSRSWDATFRKGVSWNIVGADNDNIAWLVNTTGDVKHIIKGNRFTEIKGDDVRLVYGVLEDRVLGRKVDNFVNDKQTNYGGDFSETVIGHFSQVLGRGRDFKILGPDPLSFSPLTAESTTIVSGNSDLTIALGNRNETLALGNHSTLMLAGSHSTKIVAGLYSVTLDAGSVSIKTGAGTISVATADGTVSITGSLSVSINSAVKVSVNAPKVSIGILPLQGGIVTDFMPCYLSGRKHIGSKTVSCNVF